MAQVNPNYSMLETDSSIAGTEMIPTQDAVTLIDGKVTIDAVKTFVLGGSASGTLRLTTAPTSYLLPTLSVGLYGTPVVDIASIDNIAFTANMSTGTNKSLADTSCMAAFVGVSNTAATTNNKMQGLLASTTLPFNCYDAYAVQGHVAVTGNMGTQNANAHITGISGKANIATSKTVATGWVTGGLFIVEGAGAVTQMCSVVSMVQEAGCSAAQSMCYINNDGTATKGIDFVGTFTTGIDLTPTSATTGIAIGPATTGINISGTCTDGLKITGTCATGINMTPFDGYAMFCGAFDCYTSVANGWNLGQTGHGRMVLFAANDAGTDPIRTITSVHSRFAQTKDYADTFSTTALLGEYVNPNGKNIVATSDNCNMSGVMGYMEVTNGGAAIVGVAAGGKYIYLAGVESWVEMGADVAVADTGRICGLKLSNNFKSGFTIGTGRSYNFFSETVDSVGYQYFWGTNAVGNGVVVNTTTLTLTATSHHLLIDINGAAGYIPVFDSATWA